jgi:hypothetical protein
MATHRDRIRNSNVGWRWKPVDLVLLVIGFAVWWPVGLGFLLWKLWNDRRPHPYEVEDFLQRAAGVAQDMFEKLAHGWNAAPAIRGDRELTGNEAFDRYVRERSERIAEEQRKLDEEIDAFRAFLAREKAGDGSLYERFRSSYRVER